MRRVLVSTSRFRRAYERSSPLLHELVDKALRELGEYLQTRRAPVGLGLKKLGAGVYEARAGLELRIVFVEEGSKVVLALLGSHQEVRRFLRRQ